MGSDIHAGIGREAAPQYDYDFTTEYLMKLRGVNFIPARKHCDYKLNGMNNPRSNFVSPRMQALNKARKPRGKK